MSLLFTHRQNNMDRWDDVDLAVFAVTSHPSRLLPLSCLSPHASCLTPQLIPSASPPRAFCVLSDREGETCLNLLMRETADTCCGVIWYLFSRQVNKSGPWTTVKQTLFSSSSFALLTLLISKTKVSNMNHIYDGKTLCSTNETNLFTI